jgi:thiamine biosynthesis lipoprotein
LRASARNTVIGAAPTSIATPTSLAASTSITAAGPFTVSRVRVSMGTLVAVEATAPTMSVASAALESAFAAIVAVELRMHPLNPGSDLQKISRAPRGKSVTVESSTWHLLKLTARLHALTDGVFDPCIPSRPGRLSDVELGVGSVVTCHAPVALDFGGFAKGFAVDCAVDALAAGGCSAGLVNAGGDLRCFGRRAQPILLRQPDGGLAPIDLVDAALAVSHADSAQRPPEHQGYYVRGGAGDLVNRYAAVTAGKAVIADALAKCLLLCPAPIADRALREFSAINIQQG